MCVSWTLGDKDEEFQFDTFAVEICRQKYIIDYIPDRKFQFRIYLYDQLFYIYIYIYIYT